MLNIQFFQMLYFIENSRWVKQLMDIGGFDCGLLVFEMIPFCSIGNENLQLGHHVAFFILFVAVDSFPLGTPWFCFSLKDHL